MPAHPERSEHLNVSTLVAGIHSMILEYKPSGTTAVETQSSLQLWGLSVLMTICSWLLSIATWIPSASLFSWRSSEQDVSQGSARVHDSCVPASDPQVLQAAPELMGHENQSHIDLPGLWQDLGYRRAHSA